MELLYNLNVTENPLMLYIVPFVNVLAQTTFVVLFTESYSHLVDAIPLVSKYDSLLSVLWSHADSKNILATSEIIANNKITAFFLLLCCIVTSQKIIVESILVMIPILSAKVNTQTTKHNDSVVSAIVIKG